MRIDEQVAGIELPESINSHLWYALHDLDPPSDSAFEVRRESPPQILRGIMCRKVLNIHRVTREPETHTHHGAQGEFAVAGRKRQHIVAGVVTQHA
jgi:hypothetical protein